VLALIAATVLVLAPSPPAARATVIPSAGTLEANGERAVAVTAGPGQFSALVACTTKGAKVAVRVLAPDGDQLVKTTARCAKSDEMAVTTAPVEGAYTVALLEKKGVATSYTLTITYQEPTATSTTSPPSSVPTSTTSTTSPTASSTTTTLAPGPVRTVRCTAPGDQTATVQAAIDETPDGGTLRIAGSCTITGQLWLLERRNFTLEGTEGGTLDARGTLSTDVRHVRIQSGSGITIRNLTILGARSGCFENCGSATFYRQHGLAIESRGRAPISNVLVEGVTVSGVHGDFVYLGTKGSDDIADLPVDVRLRNNTFVNSGRQGIAIAGGSEIEVTDNRVESAGRSTFDFEAEAGGASAVDILDNDIYDYDNSVLNVGCANRGGALLNRGPITLRNNRTHGQDVKVTTSCDEVRANISVDSSNRRVD